MHRSTPGFIGSVAALATAADSAHIQLLAHATLTSREYVTSLQAALSAAHV